MSSESLQKYEFKQSLERIKNHRGHATELVSLYIPPDRKIYDVQSYLRNEASQSANIKSKSTRKNVSAVYGAYSKGLIQPRQPLSSQHHLLHLLQTYQELLSQPY